MRSLNKYYSEIAGDVGGGNAEQGEENSTLSS